MMVETREREREGERKNRGIKSTHQYPFPTIQRWQMVPNEHCLKWFPLSKRFPKPRDQTQDQTSSSSSLSSPSSSLSWSFTNQCILIAIRQLRPPGWTFSAAVSTDQRQLSWRVKRPFLRKPFLRSRRGSAEGRIGRAVQIHNFPFTIACRACCLGLLNRCSLASFASGPVYCLCRQKQLP